MFPVSLKMPIPLYKRLQCLLKINSAVLALAIFLLILLYLFLLISVLSMAGQGIAESNVNYQFLFGMWSRIKWRFS